MRTNRPNEKLKAETTENRGEILQFMFDGRAVFARIGQTIAEALLGQGYLTVGRNQHSELRGVFCGMGICYECRAIVNGRPNVRICKTPVTPGCDVRTQWDAQIAGPL